MSKSNRPSTRDKILDAAQQLIMSQGYHGVSVDQIIQQAAISKGSFFYHFSSKSELPAAMLDRFLQEQGHILEQKFAEQAANPQPLDKACQLVDAAASMFCKANRGLPGCVMAAFSYQLNDDFPQVRAISQHALEGWQHGFNQIFSPICPADQPQLAEALSRQLMYLLQGANIVARVECCGQAHQQAADTFKQHLRLIYQQSA